MTRMRTYVTGWFPLRPNGEWDDEARPAPERLIVVETERAPMMTGLVDHNGTAIYAIDRPETIGFVRWKRPA